MPPSRSSTSPIPRRCLGAASGSSGAVIARTSASHLLLVAAEGAADRDPVDPGLGDRLRRFPSQVLVGPALDDPEDRLPLGALALVPGEASVEPAVGALGRAGGVLAVGVEGRALVEDEGDVGAKLGLNAHRNLRGDEQLRAVPRRLEPRPLLADLDLGAVVAGAAAALDLVGDAAVGEREDLEAAGVGDDRPLPVHEPVQAARSRNPLRPRRDEQVVGVAEDQLIAELDHLRRLQPPDRPLRRQRDESRRLDRPVGSVDDAGAGAAVTGADLEAETLRVVSHGRQRMGPCRLMRSYGPLSRQANVVAEA